ncbi:MAG: glutamate racemase [Tenericutes bacterium]|nr:glutamate racemase [Mycoplasmatota bacterium]
MNMKIGVFDSGIGGLTILKELKKIMPNESYIYYADSKNNPFGEKSNEELMTITTNIVDFLISQNVKIIVIACNTATTRCLKNLKILYPNMIFIGTVPAIKVACDKNCKNTLVMATPATIKSERTHELIKDNRKKGQKITLIPCKGLANVIERKDKEKIDKLLTKYLNKYKNKNIDSIVLGCTHYSHIKKEIKSIIKDAKLFDGNKGVANETKRQLEIHNLLNNSNEKGSTKIIYNK